MSHERDYERELANAERDSREQYDRIVELEAELAALKENPRDEYHTMDELYEYRMLYNAAFANEAACHRSGVPVVKSWRHSDGGRCFGGGWFIVVMTLPTGQVSNHYEEQHWELFHVPHVNVPPPYDGHTPAEAADRLRRFCILWKPDD